LRKYMRIILIQHQNFNNWSRFRSHHFYSHITANSSNIIFAITVADISHIRVTITRIDNNKLANKCTTANKGTRNTTIDSKHNRESTFDLIGKIVYTINWLNWSDNIDYNTAGTNRLNYNTNKSYCSTTKSTLDFLPTW